MITFVRGSPAHIPLIEPQDGQDLDKMFLSGSSMTSIIDTSICITGFADGICLGIAGLLDGDVIGEDPNTALAWALLSRRAGPYMLAITRKVKRVIDAYPKSVIEGTVVPGHPERKRWLEMMGFHETDEMRTVHASLPTAAIYRKYK